MIISVHTGKAFDKFQHIHDKTIGKKINRRNLLQCNKGHLPKKLKLSSLLVEKTDFFVLRLR